MSSFSQYGIGFLVDVSFIENIGGPFLFFIDIKIIVNEEVIGVYFSDLIFHRNQELFSKNL